MNIPGYERASRTNSIREPMFHCISYLNNAYEADLIICHGNSDALSIG